MVVGPVTKQIVKQGSKIYDAIKSGRSKTTPVSTPVNKPVKTENEIADEAYELGKEFAERGTRSETGLWEYPEQSITSADTSINVSKLPQGYTKLIKNNTFKKGEVVLDIGGGRFDNAVDTLKEKDVTVKVYDPFNRSLEHNRAVVETVRDGQADKVVSFNTLNVIPEEANRLKVIEQAHNALKENGEAFFTVYGDPKKKAGATVKGYQAHLPLKDYVSSVKEVFGEDSVTSSGGIIKAIKTSTDSPFFIKKGRIEGETLDNYRNPYNEEDWDKALELRTKLSNKEEANKLINKSTTTSKKFDSTDYYHGSQIHNIQELSLPPVDREMRSLIEKTYGSYSNPMWLDGIYITKNLSDAKKYSKSLGAVYKVNHSKDLKIWYEGQPEKNKITKKIENAFFAHLTRIMKKQNGEDYPIITKGSHNHFDNKWEDFKEKNSLHSHELITYGDGREKNLFYQEAGFNAVDSSTGAIPGTMHSNELIILNSEDLIIKETKNIKDVGIDKFKEGGTITPFGDTFNYSTTTGLNKRYLEHYHGNVLDNNLQRIDEQGQTNTMLLSTVERDGKHYILPSYDPLTKSQMKTPQDIFKLNQEAIDTGLSVGYPSKDIAEKELQKLRTTIIEDRNKLEEELELYGDFDEEGNRRTYFDPRSEEQIEAIKKRKLDEQMEKIKQRGDTSYGLATGGMISAEERDKNRNDLTQSLRFLLGQGVALGFGDEIEAYVRSKLGDKTYEENKSIIKNEMKAFETENPLTAAGLEIAGGLTSAAGIYKTLGKAGLKQMAARGTAAGGIEGGIYGAGAPEIFGTDNRLAGSAIGTGIGAALGGVGETVVGAIANTLRKNKVANISPTSTRKDILQNIPRDEKTDNYIMYHGDSMYDIKGDARPTNKGLNVPQESFVKNNPVSLAIDVENARTYAGVLTDKTGASGFLYEVSIPKKILDNVFDPFNEKHVAIFKKRINKMLYEGKGEISTDSKNWKQVKDKDAYIQNSYTDRMQLKGPMATSNNNWDVLEQPDVVEALKKEGFTGTWQKETGLETYNQIQIFDGSSVNIITENTQKIFRDNQGTYSMASLDSFLENIDTSKQGGVNTITAKEFNQKLKEAKERGEEIIFNGKDVSDLF